MAVKTELLEKVIEEVLKEANNKESEAAHMGSFSDGGAGRLRDQVHFYRLGMSGVMPTEWEKHSIKFDPDYAEWMRLNKKFGAKS